MYETFPLKKTEKGTIQGYRWPLENPEKAVCIVHGIGEYGGRYDRVASKFNEAGIAVFSMDMRGHGDSPQRKGHCAPRAEVLEDVSALLRAARHEYPGKDVILYGHSMGGNITLDYRSRGSMNGVPKGYVVSAPWIRLVRPIPDQLVKVIRVLAAAAPSFTIGSSVDEALLGNPKCVLPYHKNPMVHNRISLQCALDGYNTGLMLENGTIPDNGRADQIPLLLMHGSDDRICDIEGTRKVARNLKEKGCPIEYIEWEGLYHEIHNGGPESTGDEVIDKIADFILSC